MAAKSTKKLLKIAIALFISGLALFGMFILSVIWELWEPLPTKQQLSDIRQSEATEILDRNGELLGKYFIYDRQSISFDQFPDHLIHALIATEDARFFEHNGIDRRSLARVLFKSILLQDASAGGGSTISQQLIKNLFPRKDHGKFSMPVSKVKEAYLATKIESIYTKKEILALYLNTVPFGDNTYGVESAAEKFFSKSARELNLEESAVIVGMLKASYLYNPRLFPERSKNRRNTVIDQMQRYGYLGNEEAEIAQNKPLKTNYTPFSHDDGIAPYFRAQLQKELNQWLSEYNEANNTSLNLYTSGLQVRTTIDIDMQQMAEEAMASHMTQLQRAFENSYGKRAPWLTNEDILDNAIKRSAKYQNLKKKGLNYAQILDSLRVPHQVELWDWNGEAIKEASTLDSIQHYLKFLNAGMISLEPQTGQIRAWVGGINFEHFQYDHISQSRRQIGSTFKPIVYAAALENGLDPCEYIPARAVTYAQYDNWTPTNSGDIDEEKSYAVKTALAQSINTVAVKVLEEAEVINTIELAEDLGIESKIPPVPSIALGTPELKMIEMAKAYTAFVNNGKTTLPFFIKSIEDKNGNVLASFNTEESKEPVISEITQQMMIEMMKEVVNKGTGQRLRWKYGLNNAIAGKTGTTQNNKDGWFVALTPRLITLSWVGADEHRIGFRTTAMGQGANSALPIYALYQQKLNAASRFSRYTQAKFPAPNLKVLNAFVCDDDKEPGFFKRVFTNPEKPKISQVKIDTTTQKKKKVGLFKRIGKIFKKKDKKN